MSAWVAVARGEAVDTPPLTDTLTRAGIVFGVDVDACLALAEAMRDGDFSAEQLQVAEGTRAKPGSNGYFAPGFEPGIQPGHIDDDGKMDFRDRALLKPVRSGEALGFLHAAVPGTPGSRVDGGELPVPPVREPSIVVGSGVSRTSDGRLAAAADGVILYVAGQLLDVVQEHKHRGDVDLHSGHLAMTGSLSVSGDVQRLFRVRATGDVEIGGSVGGGSVHAGGSLSVRGAVMGGSEGELTAVGDMRLRNAERAQIRSGGLLKLEGAVNCQLEAEVIEVLKLRGGEAQAQRFVIAGEAGSDHGADTTITVGEPLELLRDEVRAAVSSARSDRWRQRARGGCEHGARTRGAAGARARPSLQRDDLERTLALRAKRDELLQSAHVVVRTVAYPGVTVQLGGARVTLTEPLASSRFSYHFPSRSIRIERFVP